MKRRPHGLGEGRACSKVARALENGLIRSRRQCPGDRERNYNGEGVYIVHRRAYSKVLLDPQQADISGVGAADTVQYLLAGVIAVHQVMDRKVLY